MQGEQKSKQQNTPQIINYVNYQPELSSPNIEDEEEGINQQYRENYEQQQYHRNIQQPQNQQKHKGGKGGRYMQQQKNKQHSNIQKQRIGIQQDQHLDGSEDVEDLVQCYEESLKDRARLSSEVQRLQEYQNKIQSSWEQKYNQVQYQLQDMVNKNSDLLSLLTNKEKKIDQLSEKVSTFKEIKPDSFKHLQENLQLKKDNQDLAKQNYSFKNQLQEKDQIIKKKNEKITFIEKQFQNIIDQNEQGYSLKASGDSDNFKRNMTVSQNNFQETKDSIRLSNTARSSLDDPKFRYTQQKLSGHNSSRIKSVQISQTTSPKHSRFQSQNMSSSVFDSLSIYRTSPDFQQSGPSQVFKNIPVPYLGDYPTNRSKSPQKKGLEEMRCPFLSGTQQRWENSLRGSAKILKTKPTKSVERQSRSMKTSINSGQNQVMKRADQLSQEIRNKMTKKL